MKTTEARIGHICWRCGEPLEEAGHIEWHPEANGAQNLYLHLHCAVRLAGDLALDVTRPWSNTAKLPMDKRRLRPVDTAGEKLFFIGLELSSAVRAAKPTTDEKPRGCAIRDLAEHLAKRPVYRP